MNNVTNTDPEMSQAKGVYEQKVVDDIDEEISFAYGIEAALEGLDLDYDAQKQGILQLQRTPS
jgi:hypothetical protein